MLAAGVLVGGSAPVRPCWSETRRPCAPAGARAAVPLSLEAVRPCAVSRRPGRLRHCVRRACVPASAGQLEPGERRRSGGLEAEE